MTSSGMDGWQTWAMRDVSVASYHATRSYFASADEQWRKLLNHLNGKEITSAGHLSARNFTFGEEIIESDGKLNFYLQADFDVDAAFGTLSAPIRTTTGSTFTPTMTWSRIVCATRWN